MPLSRGAPGSLRMRATRGGWRGGAEAASCFREVCLIGIGNAADLPSSRTLKGKYLPRHILGGVGDQIADKIDNVFNLGITAENRRKGFPPLPFFLREPRLGHGGVCHPWTNRVNQHVVGSKLGSQRLHEGDDSSFGGSIMGCVRCPYDRQPRGYANDAPLFSLDHMPGDCLGAKKDPL